MKFYVCNMLNCVPVDDEPFHKERWRSDTIRLLCAHFPPHVTCLWHEHRRYTVYICITPVSVVEYMVDNQEATPMQWTRGQVFGRDHSTTPFIHKATNMMDDDIKIVALELLTPYIDKNQETPLPYNPTNAIEIVHESKRTRVSRIRVNCMESDPKCALSLSTEAVVVTLDPCTLEIRHQDGSTSIRTLQGGSDVHLQRIGEQVLTFKKVESSVTFFLIEIY